MTSNRKIAIDRVTVDYAAVRAVSDVSLDAATGETVAIIGANGAGKTSLMRAAVGATAMTSGRVFLDGEDITSLPTHARARRGLALVPEGRGLLPRLSVMENLQLAAFGIGMRRAKSAEVRLRIDDALAPFPKLRDRRSQFAGTLSGGEQQMLVIARALVTRPRVLLLDEISLGLAPLIVEQMYEILGRLKRDGLTMVIVEQYANIALQLADRAYVVRKGMIVLSGRSSDLSQSEELQGAYLGSATSEAAPSAEARRSRGRPPRKRASKKSNKRGISRDVHAPVEGAYTDGLE